jgi:NodT family efflux transporter outer membrane factor (OMF) lipoprotein
MMIYFFAGTRHLLRVAVAGMAMGLSACASGPDFVRPVDALAQARLEPQDGDARLSGQAVPAAWWDLFGDATLSALQAEARHANLDVQAAAARIEESRAQWGLARSRLAPQGGAGASYAREALSEHGKFAALGAPTDAGDFWQTGFDAHWELDLWGRLGRGLERADALLEARLYEREAVHVTLSAEIARAYLQLRGMEARIGIAAQQQKIAAQGLQLTENRMTHGVATRFDVSTARARLADVEAQAHEWHAQRDRLLNALARLLGEAPRALDARLRSTLPLPALPERVPVGLSSELARRRPDILRAEAELHSATAAIGIAQADFYPRIHLQGRLGLEAFEAGDLASWHSRFFSLGPTVYLPLFQGGRLKQQLALSGARQKSAAIAYRQTVLCAWHEVDDALNGWADETRRHAALRLAAEQQQQALAVAQRAYREGAADYLAVLRAETQALASRMAASDSTTAAALTLVNLYKALGGGWNPEDVSSAVALRDAGAAR